METDDLLTPGRHYPAVEISASHDGLVRCVVRRSAEPGDYDLEHLLPDCSIELFCAEHLPKVGQGQSTTTVLADYEHMLRGYAEPGSPRVLCDPIGNCIRCGRQVQAWDYEHGEARRVDDGHAADALLCSENCADQFVMDYSPWEPEDRS